MGGFIKRDVQREETTTLTTTINKEVFNTFKDCCKKSGYPLNMVLEIFMRQYVDGRFKVDREDVLKYKDDGVEVSILNTTFNKEICLNFKSTCKTNGYFVKNVITVFMEKFSNGSVVLEYVNVTENKEE